MPSDFLIVNKKILPACLEQVIEARRLLDTRQAATVTEAVRQVGISRNTYYKYKDYVFQPEEALDSRRASISLLLGHKAGVLSAVLQEVTQYNASVITIFQSTPVAMMASVTMVLDITRLQGDIDELVASLQEMPDVHHAQLDALE